MEGAAGVGLFGADGEGVDVGAVLVDGHDDVRELVVEVDDEGQRVGDRQQRGLVAQRRCGEGVHAEEPAVGGEDRFALWSRQVGDAADRLVQDGQGRLVAAVFGEAVAQGPPAVLDVGGGEAVVVGGVEVDGGDGRPEVLGTLVEGYDGTQIHDVRGRAPPPPAQTGPARAGCPFSTIGAL